LSTANRAKELVCFFWQTEPQKSGSPGSARNREIVAYCRGPYCFLVVDAAAALQKRGLNARRLQDGYPELQAAGLPIAQG
jgi:rhodanese-related sulfurtransferase